MRRKKHPKTLVAAHDLGGANQVIYSFLGSANGFALTGPAQKVGLVLGLSNLHENDHVNLANFDKLVVSSNLLHQYSDQLLIEAKSLGIPTVGFLDHWVNYRSRWPVRPDKIVVTDLYALLNALAFFGLRVRLYPNSYLKKIRNEYDSFSQSSNSRRALFIIQPVGDEYIHRSQDPNCVCNSVEKLLEKHNVKQIKFRDHVDTDSSQCLLGLSQKHSKIEFSISDWADPLELDVFECDLVIGLDSYALYIARKLGKKVLSTGKRRAFLSPVYRRL
jgi:hypothetical protein